jgi:hypothetical protein
MWCLCGSRPIASYTTQALAVFQGGQVVAAAADYSSSSGAYLALDTAQLFFVTSTGALTSIGGLVDASSPYSLSIAVSGLTFAGNNVQCSTGE